MRKLSPNDRIVVTCVAVFVAMVGLTYASVPLYRLYCQVTGFDGTPRIATANNTTISERTIEVRFDSNVGPGLPWTFGPKDRSVTVHLGENQLTFFRVHNQTGKPTFGKAVYNVTPEKAAPYFNKIHCFCYDAGQLLQGGQTEDLGVTFFVDPAIATDPTTKDVQSITLSYTFYPATPDANAKTAAAAQPARQP